MRLRRTFLGLAFAVIGALAMAACTPHQVQWYLNDATPAQRQAVDDHIRFVAWTNAVAEHNARQAAANGDKFRHVLSDAQLARLRQCESGGNYSITNPSGRYRGAYQFDRPTWDGVAARHYPHLRGVDPARAAPHQQDAMARALWSERGRQPWPHCGRRV